MKQGFEKCESHPCYFESGSMKLEVHVDDGHGYAQEKDVPDIEGRFSPSSQNGGASVVVRGGGCTDSDGDKRERDSDIAKPVPPTPRRRAHTSRMLRGLSALATLFGRHAEPEYWKMLRGVA